MNTEGEQVTMFIVGKYEEDLMLYTLDAVRSIYGDKMPPEKFREVYDMLYPVIGTSFIMGYKKAQAEQ